MARRNGARMDIEKPLTDYASKSTTDSEARRDALKDLIEGPTALFYKNFQLAPSNYKPLICALTSADDSDDVLSKLILDAALFFKNSSVSSTKLYI